MPIYPAAYGTSLGLEMTESDLVQIRYYFQHFGIPFYGIRLVLCERSASRYKPTLKPSRVSLRGGRSGSVCALTETEGVVGRVSQPRVETGQEFRKDWLV